MVKRVGGSRRKTRRKFAKSIRQKGKISLKNYFQKFKSGDMVCLKAEPAYQKGLYFRRFHGKTGKIIKSRGTCYEILFKDGGKLKTFVVHPVHLKMIQNGKH
ncbi:50S ribosomal protein L21e [Candidatus Woesearchaeota archaeon]|nr:50S ribosomal protein L21e [Candidatus Woesearchaeota archaeon]